MPHKCSERRFWAKIDVGDCWEWTAYTQRGYGRFHLSGTTKVLAHRYCYEMLMGEIPAGLQLDHLCRNRKCCNPDHLEPVTQSVNNKRGNSGLPQKLRTHCPKGHPYDAVNTYRPPNGQRSCRTCGRDAWHAWNAKRKTANAA